MCKMNGESLFIREAVKNYFADFVRKGRNPVKTAIFGQKTLILALFDPFF